MEYLNLILHLDKYLVTAVTQYHAYIYIILFIIIFCETGLVVTPFLPGDSLLFVAGGIAATGQLDFVKLIIIIFLAAFCGDNSNFFIGKFIGDKLFANPKSKIFRQDLLKKTHNFYERHGRATVIIARFIPLIRTFAPFVAGLGHMTYSRFIIFSSLGSVLWVSVFLGGGYVFGNLPLIKDHLSIVILIVMIISVLPAIKIVRDEIRHKK
jgi:membrane-associated protein